jgi:hypothetical protein
VVRYSFLVRLFHPLLHAGLSRRTALAIIRQQRPTPNIAFAQYADRAIYNPSMMIFGLAVVLGIPALVGWGFICWHRNPPQKLSTTIVCSLTGFISASLSALLAACAALYQTYTHPPDLLAVPPIPENVLNLGLLTAALGLILGLCGAIGKSPVRWKTPPLSAMLILLWFGMAFAQNPI